ncbi:hypothetical protein BC829DRAFT_421058 [Chytridium lagenaria]|nr:hypothetical protein BC829DRAFT_421058 [Chytridium lagenaria]
MFVDAPRDRSRPGLDKPQPEVKGKGKARVMPNLAINLENPQASGVPANWVLVANYHTHPLQNGNPKPSPADLDNAWDRVYLVSSSIAVEFMCMDAAEETTWLDPGFTLIPMRNLAKTILLLLSHGNCTSELTFRVAF